MRPLVSVSAGLVLAALVCGSAAAQQQPAGSMPANAPTNPSTPASPAASTPAGFKTASALLEPGLDAVKDALATVRVDRWKAPGAVKDETDGNLNSIRRDVDTTLPGLLVIADAAPDSVTKVLPAYRNIEALYDVLLRVMASTRMFGPSQQDAALEQAMINLDAGRRGLGDQMQLAAAAQDKQAGDLRTALKAAQSAPTVSAAAPCPPPPPVKKKRPATKPAAKPAAPAAN
jgi:hypothetical protein